MKDDMPLYSLVIPGDTFDKIRDDKTFIEVLKLARVVNSLQFVIRIYKDKKCEHDDNSIKNTPLGLRQGFNAFLYCGALLAEGIKIIQDAKGRFKEFESHMKLSELFKNNKLIAFEDSKVLFRIRNKIVFHFDAEVFRESLLNVKLNEVVFARSHTTHDEDIDYCLGDELVFRYLYQTYTNDWDASDDDVIGLIEDVIELTHQFIQTSNSLIAEVMKVRQWVEYRESGGAERT